MYIFINDAETMLQRPRFISMDERNKKLYLKKCRALGLNFKLCVLNLLVTRTKNKRRETKCHHIQVVTSKKKKKK